MKLTTEPTSIRLPFSFFSQVERIGYSLMLTYSDIFSDAGVGLVTGQCLVQCIHTFLFMCFCICDCILVVLAVLLPPLPVWIVSGFCSTDSLINVCLFFLGYFPGLIHAWYLIATRPPIQARNPPVYYVYHNDIESQIEPHLVSRYIGSVRHQSQIPTPSICLHTATYGSIEEPHLQASLQNQCLRDPHIHQVEHAPNFLSLSPGFTNTAPPAYNTSDHKVQH